MAGREGPVSVSWEGETFRRKRVVRGKGSWFPTLIGENFLWVEGNVQGRGCRGAGEAGVGIQAEV